MVVKSENGVSSVSSGSKQREMDISESALRVWFRHKERLQFQLSMVVPKYMHNGHLFMHIDIKKIEEKLSL